MTTPRYEPEATAAAVATVSSTPGTGDASTLRVGATASITRRITQRDIDAFAAVSGDDQPLHLDAQVAAQSIFGGIVAHGMLSGAIWSAVLGKHIPGPGTILMGWDEMRFTKPVRPGDEVTFHGEVVEIGERGKMKVKLTAIKSSGELAAYGTACVVYRR